MLSYDKQSVDDEKYLAERKTLSERYGSRELWNVIDHWPLYAGVGNIARFLGIYEIVKAQIAIPGVFAEFGSWRGANLLFMAKILSIIEPMSKRRVHCFDSFEGLTEFSPEDKQTEQARGTYKGSFDELADFVKLYQLEHIIHFHKGYIEKTLPVFLEEDPGVTFSLIYFDADLYGAAVTVLDNCHCRLAKGGVIIFDEWNLPTWPGEGQAVREFMERHNDSYVMEAVPNTVQPSLILRKTC